MKRDYNIKISVYSSSGFTVPQDWRVTRESTKIDHENKFVFVMYKLYGGKTVYRCYSYKNLWL